jgi:hypothetical protein
MDYGFMDYGLWIIDYELGVRVKDKGWGLGARG